MQWLLISIKDAKNIDGMVVFINGKNDEVRESLHGFTADILVADSGGSGRSAMRSK